MLCYVMLCYVMTTVNRLHERESKTVLDSKFHSLESRSPDTGFQIPRDSGSWIQDSNRYWDSGFLKLILDSTSKHLLDSGNSIRPYMGRSYTLSHSHEKFPLPCDINRCDDIAVIIIMNKKVASTAFL